MSEKLAGAGHKKDHAVDRRKRGGQRRAKTGGRPFRYRDWPHQRFVTDHGLYKLLGTIRYPGKAYAT